MSINITHKPYLAYPKPYIEMESSKYLEYLKSEKDNLHYGNTGVYLSREIVFDKQNLYFPFIDIDASVNTHGDEKIESAICNATLTINTLNHLGVLDYFRIIATGNTGFRMISHLLLNRKSYNALVEFVKFEMPHIIDLQPSVETEMPHQLFVYKGNSNQKKGKLIDRSSVEIPINEFITGIMTPERYKLITSGKPDPNTFIDFMENYFSSLKQITDIRSLGKFGEKIEQYEKIIKEVDVNPFNYIKLRKDIQPIAPEIMLSMLQKNNIYAKVEKRGKSTAISFFGLQCPSCNKTGGNAYAKPPHYILYCFKTSCDANRGIPLHKWAGINIQNSNQQSSYPAHLKSSDKFMDKNKAWELIESVILNKENSLSLFTPGVGKTHKTLETSAKISERKQIIYSSFNKALQQESFEKIKSFSKNHDNFHLIESRETLCQKKDELNVITKEGYSPAELLCPGCEHRKICRYFKQKESIQYGVYFVTHHMLQYLEALFPDPDLIILDENLISGFLLNDQCSGTQLRSIASAATGIEYNIIDEILKLGNSIGTQIVRNQSHPMIINGRRLTTGNETEDSIIGILAKQQEKTEDDILGEIKNLVSKINKFSKTALYRHGVNLKAVDWLKGLIDKNKHSFMLITNKGECIFNTKYITPFHYKNTPVKVLDATGDERAISAILKRKVNTVRADVEWKSKKVHIKLNTSRGVLRRSRDIDFEKLLIEMLKEVIAKNVMVITYKFLSGKVTKICQKIDPKKSFFDYHFLGPRGINAFEKCDAVIVLGLPYSNLNSSAQDAYILFPDQKDAVLRDSWVDSCMMWELVQNIHRIRPVNKDSVEIVIASSFWPTILPSPDKIIDKSRSGDKKDFIIERLEPYVKEFGFLNSDIGFLANVYLKTKTKVAKEFRRKIFDVLFSYAIRKNGSEEKSKLRVSSLCEDLLSYYTNTQNLTVSTLDDERTSTNQIDEKENFKSKLILVLYILYYYNYLKNDNVLTLRIINLIQNNGIVSRKQFSKHLSPSNTKQWAEILNYFKDKYNHFESFKIKLPHARGNFVAGVGKKDKVIEFYRQLNEYEIFKKINVDTYKTEKSSSVIIEPIPDGYVSVYIPDKDSQFLHFGFGEDVKMIYLDQDLTGFKRIFEQWINSFELKIITNNGKVLAKYFIRAGLNRGDIFDVVLNEKLISNGEVGLKSIDLEFISNKHDLGNDADITMAISNLYKVWMKQAKIIDEYGMRDVYELEKRLIWITADIEMTGIQIDPYGMIEYQDKLRKILRGYKKKICKVVPDHISLTDSKKLTACINKIFRIKLDGINKDSVKSVTDPRAKKILTSILNYRKLKKEITDIDRYIGMIDNEDRIHDEIEQINTVTGRFYRELQRVKKSGQLRSFFKAKDGYKMILADYSQQEARIIAGLSKDEKSINIFKNDKDIYLEVAMAITGKDEKESRVFRQIAKKIVIGLNNGQTAYSLCPDLIKMGYTVTMEQVNEFIDRYFEKYSAIINYQNEMVDSAKFKGFISTSLGRRLAVTNETKRNSLINFPIQATGSDGFKLALYWIVQKLNEMDAKIVHILHDEVIVEARKDIADKVAGIVKECMEKALERLVPGVPFKVNPEIRDAWGI